MQKRSIPEPNRSGMRAPRTPCSAHGHGTRTPARLLLLSTPLVLASGDGDGCSAAISHAGCRLDDTRRRDGRRMAWWIGIG